MDALVFNPLPKLNPFEEMFVKTRHKGGRKEERGGRSFFFQKNSYLRGSYFPFSDIKSRNTLDPGGKMEETENPEESRFEFSVGEMKKLVSVLFLAMVIAGSSAGVYAMQSNGNERVNDASFWPKFRLNWHITVMINMKSFFQNCESGEGFCFFVGFHRDNMLSGKQMPGEVGPTSDGRYLAVKISEEAVERYSDGRYLHRFKDKRSIYMPESVYFPEEVWKKMGMEPVMYKAGNYNLVPQDGAYYILFPLQ